MDNTDEIASNLSLNPSNTSFDSDTEKQSFKKLLKTITSFYLNSLDTVFKQKLKNKPSSGTLIHKERGLTKTEFVDVINEIFGDENYTQDAIDLFKEIDRAENYEITWLQFLDYLTNVSEIKPYPKLEFGNHKISAIPHVMRDTIIKIVLIESDKYFCYAIISKYGRVGLYDGNLNFLISYHVIMAREDITRTEEERRRRNRWITDAIYLPDIFMLFITNSTRSITIYDASGLKHVPVWLIIGYPNIICNMSYYFEENSNINVVYVGDETGVVTSFTFLQSKVGLLHRKHNDKLNVYYWNEMPKEKDFLIIKDLYKAHNDMIKRIKYFSDNNIIVTCSRDVKASVVIKTLLQNIKPYVFSMRRGSNCFSLSKSILITGSDDGTIRIWNSVITSKPLAILNEHDIGIVDIATIKFLPFFISCSRDGVVKLWDIKSEICIQTKTLKFPSFKVYGKAIEWGINSIYPGPKRQECLNEDNEFLNQEGLNKEANESLWRRSNIIIACCNYIATINMLFLDTKFKRNFDMPVLIPPPLQNSVLIPTSWNIYNEIDKHDRIETIDVSDDQIEQYIETSLKFILDKNLLEEMGMKSNINQKIALLEEKKAEMQLNVERCAPFLALDLQEIEEIKLNPKLPVPNRKKIRSLVDNTHRMLSAASARTQIFSEPSSSSRLSSRSSIVDFD